MNRKKIEQEIERMCQENISYKGLPMPYRTGLKMFKADVVNFILSSPLLAVRLPSSVKNQDNHLYEDYIKSGKLKKQLEGK